MYKPRPFHILYKVMVMLIFEMIERDVYMMFFIYSSYNTYLLFAISHEGSTRRRISNHNAISKPRPMSEVQINLIKRRFED